MILMTVVKEKIPLLKTQKSSIGVSDFSSRQTNKVKLTKPIINPIITEALVHPFVPNVKKPYKIPPNPNEDKIIDTTSILGKVCFVTFFRKILARIILISAIGKIT